MTLFISFSHLLEYFGGRMVYEYVGDTYRKAYSQHARWQTATRHMLLQSHFVFREISCNSSQKKDLWKLPLTYCISLILHVFCLPIICAEVIIRQKQILKYKIKVYYSREKRQCRWARLWLSLFLFLSIRSLSRSPFHPPPFLLSLFTICVLRILCFMVNDVIIVIVFFFSAGVSAGLYVCMTKDGLWLSNFVTWSLKGLAGVPIV